MHGKLSPAAMTIEAAMVYRIRCIASLQTVMNRLQSMGLCGRIAQKKPLISAMNRKKRLHWAKARENMTSAEWQQYFFSDESVYSPVPQ
jgi:hypothetical protein